MDDTDIVSSQQEEVSRRERCLTFFTSNRFLMYVCCFITNWGDRMWRFAIGVYMIALYPQSLELTATYGFVHSGASLLFGAIIGDMIDRSQRLKAVRVALLIRNFSIFSCSAYVFMIFTLWDQVKDTMWLEVSKGVIIFLAVLAHLASMANQITVTKDWAVVVCGTDKDKLAEMSALFRRIDLVCKILSPIVVGQIMAFASNQASAIFICCENIITLIAMYAILRVIYRRVPRLAIKETSPGRQKKESTPTEEPQRKTARRRWFSRMCVTCISFGKGWSCYIRHPVAAAGFSLAMMYMTVLGFDNITVGYAYSQGMSPSVLSGVMAATAVTGIVGTFLFHPLRKRLGLVKTGILSFILDLTFLQMCVWSVFAPGSAFLKWPTENQTSPAYDSWNLTERVTTVPLNVAHAVSAGNTSSNSSATGSETSPVNISLILLLTGIVLSRVGLWLIDLVVTQLILETVVEKNRGKVNGVQYSLNMFLDLIKFLLVIFVPQPAYFGFLIMASFSCIVLAFTVFLVYSCRNHCSDPRMALEVTEAQNELTTKLTQEEGEKEIREA